MTDRRIEVRDMSQGQNPGWFSDKSALLRTISLLIVLIVYAMNSEHRVTVIEETQRQLAETQRQTQQTLDRLTETQRQLQQTVDRQAALEEFFHGMDPDELNAFQQQKTRKQQRR